jgi:hypothetical protein
MRDSRSTQQGKILALLISARGDWVPLPRITACAAQYNARIHELREMGHVIRSKVREEGGRRHSWFRLEPSALVTQEQGSASQLGSGSLFGSMKPEPRYPD